MATYTVIVEFETEVYSDKAEWVFGETLRLEPSLDIGADRLREHLGVAELEADVIGVYSESYSHGE